MAQLSKGDKKLLNAWAFYDWANSVYPLTISSAVFPVFYTLLYSIRGKGNYISVFGMEMKNSALISFTSAAAFLVISFMSPLLSGVADYVGNKKAFMRFFCYLGALSCIGLYWFDLDMIYPGLLCYFLGLIGFWGSLVFYNSYLPDIAFPEQQDAISAKGYSMGYIGSVLLLIVNLAMILMADGKAEAENAMRLSFIMVGVWWIGFSQYTYYYLPKGAGAGHRVTGAVLLNGFRELRKVGFALTQNVRLRRYLLGFFVYSMAVQTVMLAATYFGAQEIEWKKYGADPSMGLIVCILVIQLVAVLGAYMTSKASSRFGNIPVLVVINAIWMLLCAIMYFVTTPNQFYIMAGLVGIVMGGVQSLSRSTYSKFLPETEDTASYFSFYDVAEKIGIVLGMSIYGIIDQYTGSPRFATVFLASFFLAGLLLLLRIPKQSTPEK